MGSNNKTLDNQNSWLYRRIVDGSWRLCYHGKVTTAVVQIAKLTEIANWGIKMFILHYSWNIWPSLIWLNFKWEFYSPTTSRAPYTSPSAEWRAQLDTQCLRSRKQKLWINAQPGPCSQFHSFYSLIAVEKNKQYGYYSKFYFQTTLISCRVSR